MATLSSLHTEIAPLATISDKIKRVSELLLGAPYKEHPLIGSKSEPEQFTYSLQEFDCVTFCETCLALALSTDQNTFEETLRLLRYKNGEISWLSRNHYMTEWIKNNEVSGFVTLTESPTEPICQSKELACLSDYPTLRADIEMWNKSDLTEDNVSNGDILLFGSTKPDLDVFHLGIIVKQEGDIFLRHASKSLGGVCEELLSHFLTRNEVSGLILVRPTQKS